jgi:hypothetical protein
VLALVATIVPSTEFPPAIPFTSQAIVAAVARQNDAVNAAEFPSATFATNGEMEFVAAHATVTLALAVFALSAMLVAVTSTSGGVGGTAGPV